MKAIVIEGRLYGQFHLKLPKRYQMRTSSPVPYPSTLLGAFTKAYFETIMDEYPDVFREEVKNANKIGFLNFGEVLLYLKNLKKSTSLEIYSPSILLRDRVYSAYFSYKSKNAIPSAAMLMQHIRYQLFAEKTADATNVMGREYYFPANDVIIIYVVDNSFQDDILVKTGYKIRSIGARESFFDVISVKIYNHNEIKEVGDKGRITTVVSDTMVDVIEGNYFKLKVFDEKIGKKSKKQKKGILEHKGAIYPAWFDEFEYLIVPGVLGRLFTPGEITVKAKDGWTLASVNGIIFPIKTVER